MALRLKNKILVFLLLFTSVISGQADFPKDTSFTINSAWKKVKKKYPLASPVKSIESDKIVTVANQVYRVRGNRLLYLDLFMPSNTKNCKKPVVLMIHGGGWRSGDKTLLHPLAQQLASNNYIAVTVEYRLSKEATYPAAIYDLKEALRFLKHNSSLYGIDTTRIAILGTSAGGTLAGLLATTSGNSKFDDPNSSYPQSSSSVQGYIDMDGVLDFTHPAESGKDGDPLKPSAAAMFFGATYKENPKVWKEASPINHVKNNPLPSLFINSSIPRFHAGRDEFIKVLNAKGVYNEIHEINNTPHPYWLFYPWYTEAKDYVVKFLNEIF